MVIYHIKEVPDMAQRTRSTPLVPSEENPVIGRATVNAFIREIEEESGIPPEHFVTKINHQITWKRSSDTDNHEWILYLVDGQGLQEHVNRAAIKDPKLIKLLRTNKVGWARFRV